MVISASTRKVRTARPPPQQKKTQWTPSPMTGVKTVRANIQPNRGAHASATGRSKTAGATRWETRSTLNLSAPSRPTSARSAISFCTKSASLRCHRWMSRFRGISPLPSAIALRLAIPRVSYTPGLLDVSWPGVIQRPQGGTLQATTNLWHIACVLNTSGMCLVDLHPG